MWLSKGVRLMNILLICIAFFVLFMAAGFAGLQVQTWLAPEHKTGETKGVVGQVSGLISFSAVRASRQASRTRRRAKSSTLTGSARAQVLA